MGCELISHRDRRHIANLTGIDAFYGYLAPRLTEHEKRFGDAECPVSSIGICMFPFDGLWWTTSYDTRDRMIHGHDLHVMEEGDLMVTVEDADEYGWAKGTLIRGGKSFRKLWYPAAHVERLGPYYFPKVRDLEASLFQCQFE